MPLERVTILATYWYRINHPDPSLTTPGKRACLNAIAVIKLSESVKFDG